MSEPAAPHPDPDTARPLPSRDSTVPPMPYPSATTTRPLSSPEGTIPPMPSEATNGHEQGSAAYRRWHAAMVPLRKMMRRTPPGAV
jgi:hypothetical protein